MSIPEDVAQQLMLSQKRCVDLESDLEVLTEVLDNERRQIHKLQMELSHAMGGALSGQLLEIKALRRMLCALVLKFGAPGIVITALEMEELEEDAELIVSETFMDARTILTIRNVPLIDRLRAIKNRMRAKVHLFQP